MVGMTLVDLVIGGEVWIAVEYRGLQFAIVVNLAAGTARVADGEEDLKYMDLELVDDSAIVLRVVRRPSPEL